MIDLPPRCEWNPVAGTPANGRPGDGSCAGVAVWRVGEGAEELWLCGKCAARPTIKARGRERLAFEQKEKAHAAS